MSVMTNGGVEPHNERPAAVWSAGGTDYEQISRGIAASSTDVSRSRPSR